MGHWCHVRRVQNMHDASKKCSLILDASKITEQFFETSKMQWGLTKHGNYINESDVIFVMWLIELNSCHFAHVPNEWTYFRSVENVGAYFGHVKSAFIAPCTFWTRRRNMLLFINVIFDASCTFSTCPKWHWSILAYFHDASIMYRTRYWNI